MNAPRVNDLGVFIRTRPPIGLAQLRWAANPVRQALADDLRVLRVSL